MVEGVLMLNRAHAQVMRADFHFEDEESGSLLVHFPKAFKKIREGLEEDGGVLLFCETGQASTALVAAFLMAEKVFLFIGCQDLSRTAHQ